VRIIKRTLGDHFLDFMNANNPKGFLSEEDREIDETTISGILIITAVDPEASLETLKDRARKIYELSKKEGKRRIPITHSYNHVAEAFGYRGWDLLKLAASEGAAPNLRHNKRSLAEDIHSAEARIYSLIGIPEGGELPEGFRVRGFSEDQDAVYKDFRQVVDQLVAEGSPIGQAEEAWILHQHSHSPARRVRWVSYKGVGVYASINLLESLRLRTKKLRWRLKARSHLKPTHHE
jgi:hypothetical protein